MSIISGNIRAALVASAVMGLPALPAGADEAEGGSEESFPYVEGELGLELGDDYTFRSTDPANRLNDLYFLGELGLKFGLTRIFSINAGVTVRSVLDPRPATDRYFGDLGLYVDTLNLQADIGDATLVAGKYGPGFGTAWDITPGVYGTDFAEDYELAEMIGVGAAYTFRSMYLGAITLGGNVFFADTTFLSDSLFTSRGPLHLSDGGAGNTERLDNVSFTLDGTEIPSLPGFSWHLGYRHLSAGVGDVSNENGFAAGLAKEFEAGNGVTVVANGEVAYFDGFGGTGLDALYLTSGFGVAFGPWHGELAGTVRRLEGAGVWTTDHIIQVSGGHEFENGVDISLGYAYSRDGGAANHTVGLRLTKAFEFSTRN